MPGPRERHWWAEGESLRVGELARMGQSHEHFHARCPASIFLRPIMSHESVLRPFTVYALIKAHKGNRPQGCPNVLSSPPRASPLRHTTTSPSLWPST